MAISKFINLSIWAQLIVLAVLLTLPVLGIIIYSGISTRAEDYRKAAIESQKLADNLSAELEQLIHGSEQLGGIIAELPEVKNHDVSSTHLILLNTLQKNPHYNTILITDETGKVWASTISKSPDESVTERRYFKAAKASRRFSSGEFVISKVTKNPTIHLSYPIIDQNSFRGVVVMAFNLDILREILGRSQLPDNSNYVVVDHNGIIVGRGLENGQAVGKPIQADDMKRMETGPDKDTYEFTRSDGDRRITTYRKVRLQSDQTPFLYVRAGLSIKEAVARANKHLMYNIAALLPFVIIVFVLVSIIGKRSIVDRVVKLQIAAEQIANGDLSTRIGHEVRGGELGKLGKAFDNMAQRLADYVQERQRKSNEFSAIIQTTSDGFHVCDINGNILESNNAFCRMTGYTVDELKSMNIFTIEATEEPRKVFAHIKKIVNAGTDSFRSKLRHKDGTEIDVEVIVTFFDDCGGRFYSFMRDITDRKKLEDELLQAATYDSLTGIFNRKSLEGKIQDEVERAKRYNSTFSLIMLDIDDFKNINDTQGHHMGDRVLQNIAELVSQSIRALDAVGRWGGEEFMILLSETNGSEAATVAEKLRSALENHPLGEAGHVTASFGVTAYHAGDELDTLFKRVDDLLYSAKKGGKNRVVV